MDSMNTIMESMKFTTTSMKFTMNWSPAESHPGVRHHLESGDLIEADDEMEERDRKPQRKEQRNAKKGRDVKKEGRKHRHTIADVKALQYKKGRVDKREGRKQRHKIAGSRPLQFRKSSPISVSKPTAKRSREDDGDDMTSDRKQENAVNQRAIKRPCDKSVKDRTILGIDFFDLVERERDGGEIRFDIKEDPWGSSKSGSVTKISWGKNVKRFEDEMSMLDAAMGGTSLNQ
ncbi:uncharacterized protein EAF01_001991 [Botrytis porri]|nr:uncharacterized protein EAF01_001991 [Botrytis porri]KAF7912970.1 hypothetical protein EAF01_001991 [Botrytis porri]